jgi:hypothetical protein
MLPAVRLCKRARAEPRHGARGLMRVIPAAFVLIAICGAAAQDAPKPQGQ